MNTPRSSETSPARIRLHRGRFLDNPPTEQHLLHRERMRAILPTLGEGSYFCRTSASLIHGLPLWHADLDRVTVVRTGGGHGAMGRWAHFFTTPLVHPDVVMVDGFPVTSLEQTAGDVMRRVRFGPALAVADAALRLGASRAALMAAVASGRGCRHATEAVRRANPLAESPYESWMRAIMLQNDLPSPQLQAEFFDDGGLIGRTDFSWDRERLIAEFDGAVKYSVLLQPGQTAEDVIAAQLLRQRRLEQLGFRVMRFVASDVHEGLVVGRLRAALGDRWVDHGLCPEAHDYKRERRRP